jgi:RNA-directed DNA polymerase
MDPPKATFVSLAAMAKRPNRFQELRRRGVPKFHAAVAAGSPTGFWRMSGHPAVQQALRNLYFDGLGLPRLYVPAQA